jgi:NADPH-dependent 2,4-dienoyl-CoA reductase/sulfur reductase-like enzyme
LGPDWAQDLRLQGLSERKNVRILYKTECLRFLDRPHLHSPQPNNADLWPVYASLSSGEVVGVDIVVSATGVKPNVPSWLLGGKVELDEESGGICVDERMETSAGGVYAAGDVVSPRWATGEGSSKHWMQMRLWTQARQMGLYAGMTNST